MVFFGTCALYALNTLLLLSTSKLVGAVPYPQTISVNSSVSVSADAPKSGWWLANIARNGAPAFGDNGDYKIFRNVMVSVEGFVYGVIR